MQSICYQSYFEDFRYPYSSCNRESTLYPIVVNCAGRIVFNHPFNTDNPTGRLDYYFLYLKCGNLKITINDNTYSVNPGTLIIIPPNHKYSYHNESDDIFYYYVHFSGSCVKEVLTSVNLYELPLIKSIPEASTAIEKNMFLIFDAYVKKGEFKEVELSNLFSDLLLNVAKTNTAKQPTKQKLNCSINYINQNYTTDIKLSTLASMEFLSVSRYVTVFKETVGMPPYQYVISLRLNSACEMLKNTNLTVTQISEALGFSNCFFFSKLFKKHVKLSPNQYKKQAKQVNQIDLISQKW